MRAKYDGAQRGLIHAAHFLVPFSYGLFPVPPENANSESVPLFLSPSLGVADLEIGKARKE